MELSLLERNRFEADTCKIEPAILGGDLQVNVSGGQGHGHRVVVLINAV